MGETNAYGPNERLKRMRVDAGMTQSELSEKTGIPQASISEWERGKYPLSYGRKRHRDLVAKMAAVLGKSAGEIWRDPDLDGYRMLEFGGEITTFPEEYAGSLLGDGSPSLAWVPMRLNPTLEADEALEVTDLMMSPRILVGWKVAVRKGNPTTDGRICVVLHDNAICLYGVYRSGEKWILRQPNSLEKRVTLKGSILGTVVASEGITPEGSEIVEQNPRGLALIGAQYAL